MDIAQEPGEYLRQERVGTDSDMVAKKESRKAVLRKLLLQCT